MEFELGCEVSDDEIENLTSAEWRKNISAHAIHVAHHFDRRVKAIFNFLKTPKSLGEYHVVDHFKRVEFQNRGNLALQSQKSI